MSARVRMAVLTVVLAGIGCRGESTAAPEPGASTRDDTLTAPASEDDKPEDPASAEAEPEPYTPEVTLGQPTEIREAQRSRLVYADTDPEAAQRGRIPSGEAFHVYAEREGPKCKRAWGQVGPAAWICLDKTTPSEAEPTILPELDAGAVVPFTYARHRNHDKADTPQLPVYNSATAYREGEAAVEHRPAHGSYAFTKVRRRGGEQLLTTLDRKLMVGDELELFEPSEFAGLSLDGRTLPAGQVHAWAVRWKSMVHAEPDASAPSIARIRYHDPLIVAGEVIEVEADEAADRLWIAVPAHAEVPAGWIRVDNVRRYIPVPPPEPVLGGQVSVDVDLDEQVLSVWVEREAVFATLISSGKLNDRTPTGLYRITSKRAHGKMASRGGAKKPYFVEAVPWVMYFDGRYALHASYWHDMFGHRMSHGCINLSPRDAKRVFELVTPTLAPGWLVVQEHRQDPGTLVRVRRSGVDTPDQRKAF